MVLFKNVSLKNAFIIAGSKYFTDYSWAHTPALFFWQKKTSREREVFFNLVPGAGLEPARLVLAEGF